MSTETWPAGVDLQDEEHQEPGVMSYLNVEIVIIHNSFWWHNNLRVMDTLQDFWEIQNKVDSTQIRLWTGESDSYFLSVPNFCILSFVSSFFLASKEAGLPWGCVCFLMRCLSGIVTERSFGCLLQQKAILVKQVLVYRKEVYSSTDSLRNWGVLLQSPS